VILTTSYAADPFACLFDAPGHRYVCRDCSTVLPLIAGLELRESFYAAADAAVDRLEWPGDLMGTRP
jgi:hypothetical protein